MIECTYCKCSEGIKKYSNFNTFYCILCGTRHIDPYEQYGLYKIKIPTPSF